MARRPEHQIPAELFYGVDEARKYSHSSRIQYIQRKMAERAIELMALPEDAGSCHILDVGCGGGIGGEVLEEHGHTWVGTDISWPMLAVAREREAEDIDDDDEEDDGVEKPPPMSEVVRHDMGTSLPFRPGSFDGAISISAVQWLCNAEKKSDIPQRRMKAFFQSLYGVLRRGAKAVLQFYPENNQQLDMITTTASRCGFGGGLVVDFPHSSRAKKYYLVLPAGPSEGGYHPPRALGEGAADEEEDEEELDDEEAEDEEEWEDVEGEDDDGELKQIGKKRQSVTVAGTDPNRKRNKRQRRERKGKGAARPKVGTRSWVLMKKEQRTKFGKKTAPTGKSKYTARKRKPKF